LAELAHPTAHHFDDAVQQREAASLGMWVFLATEVMFFGGMFTAYAAYRMLFPEAFAHASHHLDVRLGTTNTAVLIASSLSMALTVRSTALGRRGSASLWLLLTALLGATFLGIKAFEYWHKFHEGLVPGPAFTYPGIDAPHAELFFSLYFAMTGFHALHMIIGLGLLAWLFVGLRRGRLGAAYDTPVELTGLYWHFVDIVWIFLFPFLYLIGRH
jgi:cytochrome c oxidase subunit 3